MDDFHLLDYCTLSRFARAFERSNSAIVESEGLEYPLTQQQYLAFFPVLLAVLLNLLVYLV